MESILSREEAGEAGSIHNQILLAYHSHFGSLNNRPDEEILRKISTDYNIKWDYTYQTTIILQTIHFFTKYIVDQRLLSPEYSIADARAQKADESTIESLARALIKSPAHSFLTRYVCPFCLVNIAHDEVLKNAAIMLQIIHKSSCDYLEALNILYPENKNNN